MIKHYVEYMYAGSFFSESSVKEIKSRNQKIVLPQGAYSYRIFDREELALGGETLVGSPKNFGPRHIVGEEYSAARVKAEIPDSGILLDNMRINDWPVVIKCRQGFLPKESGDVVIAARPAISTHK